MKKILLASWPTSHGLQGAAAAPGPCWGTRGMDSSACCSPWCWQRPFRVGATIRSGNDIDRYHRFLISRPPERLGVDAAGIRDRALAEFERRGRSRRERRRRAPVGDAYRRFGLIARAESVLREQLKRTPDDTGFTARSSTCLRHRAARAHHSPRAIHRRLRRKRRSMPRLLRLRRPSHRHYRHRQETVPRAGELAATAIARAASAPAAAQYWAASRPESSGSSQTRFSLALASAPIRRCGAEAARLLA